MTMTKKQMDSIIEEVRADVKSEIKYQKSARKHEINIRRKELYQRRHGILRDVSVPRVITSSSSISQLMVFFNISSEAARIVKPSAKFFKNEDYKILTTVINTLVDSSWKVKKVKNLDDFMALLNKNTKFAVPHNAISYVDYYINNVGNIDPAQLGEFVMLFEGASLRKLISEKFKLSKGEYKEFIKGASSSFNKNYIRSKLIKKNNNWQLIVNDANIMNRIILRRTSMFSNSSVGEYISFASKMLTENINTRTMGEVFDYLEHIRRYDVAEYNQILKRGIGRVVLETNLWHDSVRMAKVHNNTRWDSKDYSCVLQIQEDEKTGINTHIVIEELFTTAELATEGRKQSHCVFSYVRRCISGDTSIVSLRKIEVGISSKPLVTIEIYNPTKTIVQVRGRANRLANDYEKRFIRQFANTKGLKWL